MPDATKKWHEAETVLEVSTKIEYNAMQQSSFNFGILSITPLKQVSRCAMFIACKKDFSLDFQSPLCAGWVSVGATQDGGIQHQLCNLARK